MFNTDPIKIRDRECGRVLDHDYTKGPLLVLAGPGTGKTFSLLETIKRQLGKGFAHCDFFEATLTNAAADDFISEARNKITPDFESSSTLHHRAKGILHRHAGLLGLYPGFTVIEKEYYRFLLQDICYILNDPRVDGATELKKHQEASARCHSIESHFSALYEIVQFFYAAIDWFDVVRLASTLLSRYAEVRNEECEKFKFLLIDEYQDLNPAEQHFVELLLNKRTNLLVVGDDDQSIYSGRYADPAGINDFMDRYSSAKKLVLPVCSRLPSKIIDVAHSLILRNETHDSTRQRLIPLNETEERARGGFVISVNMPSAEAEQNFLFAAISELIDQGIPPQQILVLCNCRSLGIELVEAMVRCEHALSVKNDLDPVESPNGDKLLLNHVHRFVSNQNENLSLRYILARLLGTSSQDCCSIVKHSLEKCRTIWETMRDSSVISELKDARSFVENFSAVVEKALKFETHDEQVLYLISEVPDLNGLVQFMRDEGDQTEQPQEKHEVSCKKDRVRLITLHSSKGLDADYIFIPFMEESIGLPAIDMEEKRRLLYVAMTRAKVGVIFSWAWSRRSDKRFKCAGNGGLVINRKPSPFIKECGISPYLCSPKARPSSSETALVVLSQSAASIRSFDVSFRT